MRILTEFLLARIAEDEAVARDATWGSWSAEGVWTDAGNREWQIGAPDQDDAFGRPIIAGMYGPNATADVAHIARHDPARVLAECDAKRRIVDRFVRKVDVSTFAERREPAYTVPEVAGLLRLLALPYADHPDYDEAWRP